MKALRFKTILFLYMIIGILHSLLTMYVFVPISSYFPVNHTWNRNVWTVIAIASILIISWFEKKKYKGNYILICLRAGAVTFIISLLCAVIVFVLTPSTL